MQNSSTWRRFGFAGLVMLPSASEWMVEIYRAFGRFPAEMLSRPFRVTQTGDLDDFAGAARAIEDQAFVAVRAPRQNQQ
jgi:hypothetical protein